MRSKWKKNKKRIHDVRIPWVRLCVFVRALNVSVSENACCVFDIIIWNNENRWTFSIKLAK